MTEAAEAPAAGGAARPPWALLALTLVALLLRLAFLWLEPETRPTADETVWLHWGTEVLPSVGFSPFDPTLIFHPPLYAYFLGTLFASFGTLTAVKVAQAVVGALLVPAMGSLGTIAAGRRAGLFAAGIAAVYPDLVWFSAHFWAEAIFVACLFWALERLVRADRDGSWATAAVAGLLFGFSILTRETGLYFVPAAALWLAWRRPSGGRRAGAFLLAAVLVVAPWTYRNWRVYGAFVPVSTSGALNLWQGNATLSRQEVYEGYWAVGGKIAKYELARRRGLEAIRDRQPGWFFEKLRDEMPNFWEVDSQALVHLRRGAYGPVGKGAAQVATAVVVLPYLALLALFVAGLLVLPLARTPLLLSAFLFYYNLIHVVTHGYARYRLPALPVLFVVAGAALARAGGDWPRSFSWRRKALAAAVALALAISVAPSLRLMLRPGALYSEGARFGAASRGEPGAAPADEAGER